MEEILYIRPKSKEKGIEKMISTSLRVEETLVEQYDILAWKSERSRNEVMVMALQYGMEHMEFR